MYDVLLQITVQTSLLFYTSLILIII